MSVEPATSPSSHVGPVATQTTSDRPPTTGDDRVDEILAQFVSVGVDPPQAQAEAAEAAWRGLQARLTSP